MKKLAILSVTLILSLSLGQLYAQDSKLLAKNDVKAAKKEIKVAKKVKRIETRGDRRELRILKGNTVNTLSMKNFKTDFGNVPDVKWKRTSNYDIAAFTKKGQEMKAYYDADGNLVGTTQYRTIEELPERGQQILSKRYNNYNIGKVIFFNNNSVNRSSMILFGKEIVDQSSYFVELANGSKKMIVNVDLNGNVSLFKQL